MSRKTVLFFVAAGLLCLSACNRGPYYATNKMYKKQAKEYAKIIAQTRLQDSVATGAWVGTTNFNMRKPNYVVIHHTAQNSCDQTLKTFTLVRTQVSAHYVICKNGTVHHMLNNYLRAWHAGAGKWGNTTDVNSSSIGIEIDNNGFDTFSTQQISSLLLLLQSLKKTYAIPIANFIGHADIAPTRKNDPNVHFPWKQFADSGYGIWWSDTTGVTVPEDFKTMQALRFIGYDTKDTIAVIQTFNRKYLQLDKSNSITEGGRKILYSLYRKFE